jgi:hypothetical protein
MGNIWKSISEGIADFAPTIAKTILPGPIGGIASLGIKALTDMLGLTSEEAKSPKAIKKAVENMTPELALELRKENNSFLTKMKELGIEEHKLFNDGRASARDREVKTGQSIMPITWVFIVGFFITIMAIPCMIIWGSGLKPMVFTALMSTLNLIVGLLGGKVAQILSYYYGDSENGNTMGKQLTKTLDNNLTNK